MTHAEAKDLLLEHAYGELPAHVAAEVAEHSSGCDECRLEQVAVASVRKSFAPLANLEEPGEGFDARILAAARAEAQLTHDGNIGEVVEVTASEAPSGIEAASIDAYARPLPSPAGRPRAKWMKAAGALASVAAVAALAVVVGSKNAPKTPAHEDAYQIHVGPQVVTPASDRPVETALRQAVAPEEEAAREQHNGAPPPSTAGQKQAAPTAAPRRMNAVTEKPAAANRAVAAGAAAERRAVGVPAAAERAIEKTSAPQTAGNVAAQSPPAGARLPNNPSASAARTEAAPPPPAPAEALNRTAAAATDVQARPDGVAPAELERRAGAARRSGNYPLAAALYRKAAQGRTDDASSAAWDLAHAVECLSAAGSFDEARAARDQLKERYPAESAAFSAARRALREVDPRE